MVRGRGYSPTPTHSTSYHGSSSRSSWGGSSSRGDYRSSSGKLPSAYSSHVSSKDKYGPRYSTGSISSSRSRTDDHRKAYKPSSSYSSRRDDRRSDVKRPRVEASSSRRDSSGGYGKRRPLPPLPPPPPPISRSDHRRYSGDRRPSSSSLPRREEFRKPLRPPIRMAGKGRIGSRSSGSLNPRDRVGRRRLAENSYAIKRRRAMAHAAEFNRRLKLARMRSRNVVHHRATGRKLDDKDVSARDKSKETRDRENKDNVENKDKSTDKAEVKKNDDNKSIKSDNVERKKSLIDLTCPHCRFKAMTFRRYELHLNSPRHLVAMRSIVHKQKSILNQMRLAQRNAQNDLEKNEDMDLTDKTNFCPLCKLNYKQKKSVHQETAAHKNMKKFLMPHCKYCNVTFKSPMTYESHCCSIRHLKQKQRADNASDESDEEVDLEHFTTIDSIGEEASASDAEEGKEHVNIGIEQIQKIEVYHCNLCKINLARGDEKDMPKILAKHCRNRVHMKRYIRFKEDKDLEKRAEELQRKELAEKEGVIKKETVKEEKMDEEDNIDEKELGDILMKAVDKSSDDEDDFHVNGERYDRFKLSEKNGDENVNDGTEVNGMDQDKK